MILGTLQSAAFQVERLAAALLIARNIGGDRLPPPPSPPPMPAASAGIAGAETAALPPEIGNSEADTRQDAPPPSQSLLGLRTPASFGDKAATDAMKRLLADWANGMAATRNAAADGDGNPAGNARTLATPGTERAVQRRLEAEAKTPPPAVMASAMAAQAAPTVRPAATSAADDAGPDAEPADAAQPGRKADASRPAGTPSAAAAMAAILLAETDDIDSRSSTAAPQARPSGTGANGGAASAGGAGATDDASSPSLALEETAAGIDDGDVLAAALTSDAPDNTAKADAAKADAAASARATIAAEDLLDPQKLAKAALDLLPVEDPGDSLALRIGLFAAAGEMSSQQVERAGVIASFILNAAMIPGWPPPRPFVSVEVEELMTRLQKGPVAASELEVMTYLSKFGLSKELLARIFALMEAIRRRRLVMLALAILLTNARAVLESIKAELARLTEESESAEAGVVAPSGRHHLSLR